MDLDVGLRVDGIGETGELGDPAEVRNEVFSDLASTRCTVDILRILSQET